MDLWYNATKTVDETLPRIMGKERAGTLSHPCGVDILLGHAPRGNSGVGLVNEYTAQDFSLD